jgi:hypothetical protein
MIRSTLLLAVALVGLAGGAAAQTAAPAGEARREGARASTAAPRAAERPATRPAEPRRAAAQRSAGQNRPPAEAGAQRPARTGGGGLNLDLSAARTAAPTVQQRPGDAFSASGPYASQAQMQRYTGRRSIQMPQAPVQIFGTQQSVQNPFQPY